MEDSAGFVSQEKPIFVKFRWIVILIFFISLVSAAVFFFLSYKNKPVGEKVMARPIIKTRDFLDAKVGQEYQAPVVASVLNQNVEINGQVLSGLPEGLQLGSCQTIFNSSFVISTAVNSLATCMLEGIPQESGKFNIEIFFSIPNGLVNAKEIIPLVVDP